MYSHKLKLGDVLCQFETNNEPKKNDENIICFSFFRIDGVEDKYSKSLSKIIYDFKNYDISRSFKLRLYYDITTKDFVESNFNNIGYVQLYYYHFPQFFNSKNNSHFGFLGTLVRYFPFFNIENHEAKICWVIDVDVNMDKFKFNIIKYVISNPKIKFFHKTRLNYYTDRILLIDNKPNFPMISSFLYQKDPISKEIISSFMNDNLLNKKNNLYKTYLKNLLKIIEKKKKIGMFYNKRIIEEMKPFQYGVDEFFINTDLYYYYKKNNIPVHTTIFQNDIYAGIKLHAEFLKLNKIKINNKLFKFMNALFSIIDPSIRINSIEQYYELISSEKNIEGVNARRFEKNICLNSPFKKYFKLLNPRDINMSSNIYKKILLSFRYCFIKKKIPILEYINNKFIEINKIKI